MFEVGKTCSEPLKLWEVSSWIPLCSTCLLFYLLAPVSTKEKRLRDMWARYLSGMSNKSKTDIFLIRSLNSNAGLCTEVVTELLSSGLFTHLLGVNNWKLSDNVVSTTGDMSKLSVWNFTLHSWIQDLSMSLHPVRDVLQNTHHTFISNSSY